MIILADNLSCTLMKYSTTLLKFSNLLKRPFPEPKSTRTNIKVLFVISIFVTIFLVLFQPFNIHQAGKTVLRYAILFGAITFFSGLLYNLIRKYIFKADYRGDTFTFGKWIIQVTGLLLFIGFFNFLYMNIAFHVPWSGFFNMLWATVLVGIFPVIFLGSIGMIKSEFRNQAIAQSINSKPDHLKGKNTSLKTTIFEIPSDKIFYIEALQNYINIYQLVEDGLTKSTKRATLKSIEDSIKDTDLIKCHRSYIVNTSKIESVSGNAQGLKLKLIGQDVQVPVSRSFVSKFKP